jgi:hypothetical protein
MRATSFLLPPAILACFAFSTMLAAKNGASNEDTSPIFGVTIPEGYRHWELIAPAQEGEPFDELRAVLGNEVAIKAYRAGGLPFPDGTVLAKLAWKRVRSSEFESAAVPGAPASLQFMVKDSKRYASTGGWGFGKFVDGKAADEPQHHACFACHDARVKGHDFVFTRLAP